MESPIDCYAGVPTELLNFTESKLLDFTEPKAIPALLVWVPIPKPGNHFYGGYLGAGEWGLALGNPPALTRVERT